MRRLPSTLRATAQCSSALALSALACAWPGAEARRAAELEREASALVVALSRDEAAVPEPGSVRVRLAFGEGADLDLYVTDPAAETVYYANTPAQSGGRLERDVRCGAAAPRVETVTFRPAPAGRYRVGVDYPEPCDGDAEPVSYVVAVEYGSTQREQRGVALPGRFQVIVLEFELE
jgi:hypothetical protein